MDTFNCNYCGKLTELLSGRYTRKKFCSKRCNLEVLIKNCKLNNPKLPDDEIKKRLFERYNRKVIKKDGCWGWVGSTTDNYGYGIIHYGRKQTRAHRVSWRIHKGEIPENLWVLHTCDNAICSNPEHLYLGTAKDNTQDMIQRNRNNYCKQHSKNAKLKFDQVVTIKELIQKKVSQSRLASMFNVTPSCIQNIADGRTWRNV